MAKRNLRSVDDNYPILSCDDLLEYRKSNDQILPRSGMTKGYFPEENSERQKYLPSLLEETRNTLLEQHATRKRDLVQAEWDPVKKVAYATRCKGKFMQHLGEMINGKYALYPEEVLFLMETALLELYFNGAILSIQEAYRLVLKEDMALERFQVYSHLSRIGYIVVRHKPRTKDDESSKETDDLKQSNVPEASRKHSIGNECHKNDNINIEERIMKVRNSSEAEQKSKTKSRLWDGIDIPNMAGKTSIKLQKPPLHLLPKNVCPQKETYLIDLDASKNEALYGDYDYDTPHYNEKNKYSKNQPYTPDPNTFNRSHNESERSNMYQFNNRSQDINRNQTAQYDIPSTNYNNENLGSFSGDLHHPLNNNSHQSQNYVHNVQGNWNAKNSYQEENLSHFSDTQMRTCITSSSTEKYPSNNPHQEAHPSQFESHNSNISHIAPFASSHDQGRALPCFYGNAITTTSFPRHDVQASSNYEMSASSINQHNQCFDTSGNYIHNTNSTTNLSNYRHQHTYSECDRSQNSSQFQNYPCNSVPNQPNEKMHVQNVDDKYRTNDLNITKVWNENSYNVNASNYTDNLMKNREEIICEEERNYRYNTDGQKGLKDDANKQIYHDKNEYSETRNMPQNNTYKEKYVAKRNEHFKSQRLSKVKRQKRKYDNLSSGNFLSLPRINKTVTCWKEFKVETELQSTTAYLMKGPAKVLWNSDVVPLVAPRQLTKEGVFGSLSIIERCNDTESLIPQPSRYDKLDFDVYLPSTNYSHHVPGPPSHRIKVVRCKDPVPSTRCKEKIPVHYAMVDNGTVTFYSFGNVKLPSYIT